MCFAQSLFSVTVFIQSLLAATLGNVTRQWVVIQMKRKKIGLSAEPCSVKEKGECFMLALADSEKCTKFRDTQNCTVLQQKLKLSKDEILFSLLCQQK